MPRCRKCKKEWPAGMAVCPDDGTSFTVEVEATMIGAGAGPKSGVVAAQKPPTGPGMPSPASKNQPTAVLASGVGEAAAAAAAAQPEMPPPDPNESTDVAPGTVVGEYKVEKKIGEGGMGAVYSAVHPMIGKRAAIKVISAALGAEPSAVQRFVQEARSVNQIGHPNIVDVFAFGTLADGRNYFVMEYLQGESLADRLGRTTMSLGEAIEILDQVCDALDAAHEKQITHRDLKPDNVYLASVRGGRTLVKLLDFGIAKLSSADNNSGGVAKTRTGMMMGTPGYLSPEQARGRNVDHRTDLYALGCMMFEIVCGRLPFVADNAMDIVLSHMTAPPPKPSELWPEIPPQLEDVITKMLDKNPDNRPTLQQVRAIFAELVNSGLVTIDNTRPHAFRSGLNRVATPAAGVPLPHNVQLPIGTNSGQPAPSTRPPGSTTGVNAATPQSPVTGTIDAVTPKSKTPLIAGIVGGVVVLGGIGAFVATRGGDKKTDPPKIADGSGSAAAPGSAAVVTPPVTPPPVVDKTVSVDAGVAPPPAPKGGKIELAYVPDKGAKLEVDGKEVTLDAKMTSIPVDADGEHTIAITAPGKMKYEQKVTVTGGASQSLQVKLEREKKGGTTVAANGGQKTTPGTGSGSAKTTTNTTPPGTGSAGPKKDDALDDPFAEDNKKKDKK